MFGYVVVAVLVATTITTLALVQILIAQVNKTGVVPRIPHKMKWGFGELGQIKRTHQRLLPNSNTFRIFRGFEAFQLIAGAAMLCFILASFINSLVHN